MHTCLLQRDNRRGALLYALDARSIAMAGTVEMLNGSGVARPSARRGWPPGSSSGPASSTVPSARPALELAIRAERHVAARVEDLLGPRRNQHRGLLREPRARARSPRVHPSAG